MRLLRFILAAATAALAGLLVRRLLLQAGTPSPSLPGETQGFADSQPEQPVGEKGAVSPEALRSASRSLPGTREELYRQAARLGVRGRSRMNKRQLHDAVQAQSSEGDS